MKRSSILIATTLFAATLILFDAGCRTPQTPDQQAQAATNLARVCAVTKAVVQTGLTADLIARPADRPLVIAALAPLDEALRSGAITGAQLAGVVAGLPIRQDTIRVVTGALLVYDAASALWYTGDTQKILLALGQAVSDGAHNALFAATAYGPALSGANVRGVKPPAPIFTGPGANVIQLR